MPKLTITKQVNELGEARDYLLSIAEAMNVGHYGGDGWSLAETPDEINEEVPPSPDVAELEAKREAEKDAEGEGETPKGGSDGDVPATPATPEEVNAKMEAEKRSGKGMPWDKNKGKK